MAQLNVRTQNEEGERVTRTFHLEDEHAPDETEQLEVLAQQAERVPELRSELNETQDELDAAQEHIVSDIIRRKKLAGDLEGEDEIEDEREFLEGLPVDRLKKHSKRPPSGEELSTDSATDPSKSPNSPANGVYGDAVK
jgi:hypothetical protein